MKYILAVLQASWSPTNLPCRGCRRCRPVPSRWRQVKRSSWPASRCRYARCSRGLQPGSECSRPRSLRPRCAWPGPRCSRCWSEPSSLTGDVRGAQDLGCYSNRLVTGIGLTCYAYKASNELVKHQTGLWTHQTGLFKHQTGLFKHQAGCIRLACVQHRTAPVVRR